MGRELTLAMPELVQQLQGRWHDLERATRWVYSPSPTRPHPLDQLWGASYLSQLHVELSRTLLGLRPHAALGYSSGESNALFAFGAWRDIDAMVRESDSGTLFHSDIAGEFAAVRRAWRKLGSAESGGWQAFRVSAPLASASRASACVRAGLASSPTRSCATPPESSGTPPTPSRSPGRSTRRRV